ncbi:MAG: hypothetical protein IJI45_06170 [Anaerolineaceae bacterium]|nr:hypothetical protein [Anaerolineaceae bacterium]
MEPELAIGSVQVSIAAKAYGKDACWVRAGLICGWLPIGNATRHGKLVTTIEKMDSRLGRINYYNSPKTALRTNRICLAGRKIEIC